MVKRREVKMDVNMFLELSRDSQTPHIHLQRLLYVHGGCRSQNAVPCIFVNLGLVCLTRVARLDSTCCVDALALRLDL